MESGMNDHNYLVFIWTIRSHVCAFLLHEQWAWSGCLFRVCTWGIGPLTRSTTEMGTALPIATHSAREISKHHNKSASYFVRNEMINNYIFVLSFIGFVCAFNVHLSSIYVQKSLFTGARSRQTSTNANKYDRDVEWMANVLHIHFYYCTAAAWIS